MVQKKFDISTDRFRAFLQLHPSINWYALEKEAGVRRGLIKKWMGRYQELKPEQYLRLLFKSSNYCNDAWMLEEASKLFNELDKAGTIKDIKFK